MCVATRDRKRTANLEGFGFAPQVGGDSAPRSVAYFRAAIGTAVWCRRGTRGETRSNHRETVLRARVRCAEGTVEDEDAPPKFWRSFFGKKKKNQQKVRFITNQICASLGPPKRHPPPHLGAPPFRAFFLTTPRAVHDDCPSKSRPDHRRCWSNRLRPGAACVPRRDVRP